MADEKIPVRAGDPCPVCGGAFAAVQGAPVKDASVLQRCAACGYQTRIPVGASGAAAAHATA